MKKYEKKKIALLLIGVSDLSGGGGAQRFFSDVYDYYRKKENANHELYFVTDTRSFKTLAGLGKFRDIENVIVIRDSFRNRIGKIIRVCQIVLAIIKNRFAIVHLCFPDIRFLPVMTVLSFFPQSWQPKIALSMVDCTLAHQYLDPGQPIPHCDYDYYRLFFASGRISGIFTFYELFKEIADKEKIFSVKPVIIPAKFCFCDSYRFRPSEVKKNVVVFAARMVVSKQPLFFVEAVRIAYGLDREAVKNWTFLMYGKGPMETQVSTKIEETGLKSIVSLHHTSDMSGIFAESKIFVSTQDYENFTSLSMLEAMASGNAIIARNVGQTNYFVKHMVNGLIMEEDTPHGLAIALLRLMNDEDLVDGMQKESGRIAAEVHNAENFLSDIDNFWSSVLKS